MTLNIEKTRIIVLYSSEGFKRISRMITDKLSSQGNIILQSHPDEGDRVIFRKIDLADELFIIDGLNDRDYNKAVEYAKRKGKRVVFLSQTPLNSLIDEYRNVKKQLRSMRKNIITYRTGLEEAIENVDVKNIKHYSEQLRKSIIEYDNLRKRYHEVKGEMIEARL